MGRKTMGDEIERLKEEIKKRDGRIEYLEGYCDECKTTNVQLLAQIAAARKQGLAEAAKMIMEALTEGEKGE